MSQQLWMDIVTLVAHVRILAGYYTNMNMNRQNSIILNTVIRNDTKLIMYY